MRKALLTVLATVTSICYAHDPLHDLYPNVKCAFTPSQYEQILMTKIRDRTTDRVSYRDAAHKLGALLVNKVIECLPTTSPTIQTPLAPFVGRTLSKPVELVSIMRSGDALVEVFMDHFPDAPISKILVQRDEETAKANFKYMKLSPTIASDRPVVITEPMLATGGTLDTVITRLTEKGVKEENIIVASVCVAPEGLRALFESHPKVQIVITALDERLNEKKYIVPGLGDFGDRYFGTEK